MKSLDEIEDILNNTFHQFEDMMNYEQFIQTVQNQKSDVYLQLICFLYQKSHLVLKILIV